MFDRLEKLQDQLEVQVADRTKQLTASNELGRVASSSLDPERLLVNVMNLFEKQFGYYFAAIYLLDPSEKWVVLKEATGDPGKLLKQNHHRLEVAVDRTKAHQAGFTERDIASNLLITLSGSFQTNPSFFLNPKTGVNYNVITQAPQYRMDSLQALSNIPVSSATGAQWEILGSLSTVSRGAERAVINHWNVQPVIDLYANVQGRDLGGVADEILKIVDESAKDLPKGARLIVRGQGRAARAERRRHRLQST